MPLARHLTFACALVLALSAAAQSPRTNNPAPPAASKSATKLATAKPAPPVLTGSFDDFKNVPDRNIFNTRRSAGRSATASEAPAAAPRRERVVETFSLLGTLEYEKGRVAFFEGSSTSSRKSAKVDDTIAGCKITAIEPSGVTLEANGKAVELKVGYMLRREDDGEWQSRLAERPYESSYSSGYSSSSSSPFGSSTFGSSSSFGSSSRYGSSPFSSSSSSSFSRDSRSSSSRFGGSTSPQEYAMTRLREQDRNGDGKVSRDEADSRLRDRFRDIDRNGDGYVDAEEYTAYYIARMGGSSFPSSSSSGSSFNPGTPSTFNSGTPSSFTPPSTFAPGAPTTFNPGTPPPGSSFGNPSTSPVPTASNSSSSTSSGGAGESELLRRLMEQRARENR